MRKIKQGDTAQVWCKAYTDGACSGNPGAGGWAVMLEIWPICIIEHGGEDETTNNRMELLAVVKAMREFLTNERLRRACEGLEVKSDSAYVVNAVNQQWIYKWRLKNWTKDDGSSIANVDLWQEFFKLHCKFEKHNIPIRFIKVKGHAGVYGNEAVDWIAHEESQRRRKRNGKRRN